MKRIVPWLISSLLVFLSFIPPVLEPGEARAGTFLPDWTRQPVPEIPLTDTFGVGVRGLGMGGAHAALSEDLSALYYNPACLAQLRRIEFSGTISYQREKLTTSYFGESGETSLGSTRLNALGVAYPFPTYRGSLVFAIGYQRPQSLDSEYWREGARDTSWSFPGQEREAITERGGLSEWTLGMAFDASEVLSIGGTLEILRGKSERKRSFSLTDIGNESDVYALVDQWDDLKIRGWSVSFGLLLKASRYARLGMRIGFPRKLTFEGTQSLDSLRQFPDPEYPADSLIVYESYEEYEVSQEITLPFTFSAGIALTPPYLTVSADVVYSDWREIEFLGPLKPANQYAYRPTTQIHAGIEIAPPGLPIRLRGGYYTEPLPYKLLLVDVVEGTYADVSISKDRRFYTLGLGMLFSESVSIDFAWLRGSFKRSALPRYSYTENKDMDRFFTSVAYRF